jgi:hypothetical protein
MDPATIHLNAENNRSPGGRTHNPHFSGVIALVSANLIDRPALDRQIRLQVHRGRLHKRQANAAGNTPHGFESFARDVAFATLGIVVA